MVLKNKLETMQIRLYVKVLEQWRREQKEPHTWSTIVDALEAVGDWEDSI